MTDFTNTIEWEQDADGVVILTLNDPNQSANTMNVDYGHSMHAAVERLQAEKEQVKGVIIRSAKKTFFAGGDLNDLKAVQPEQAADFAAGLDQINADLRTLETLGIPVVAAINGAALGGGLEICLATHHRVAIDSPQVKLGFPEVKLGLLPGGGGVTRTVRMFGIAQALMGLLLQGQELRPDKAKEMGLIDEIVPTIDGLVPAAKAWIAAQGDDFSGQPWDVKGYKIPGGTPSNPQLAQMLPAFPANLRKQIKGANYPAPHHIMAAAVEGAQVDFDSARSIEGRYFVDLATSPVAKNMIEAFFFNLQEVNGLRGRDKDAERWQAEKVAVLGAGMMGAGIAYQCAKNGIEVVLKDVSVEAAERGKGYSQGLVDKAVGRGRMTQEKADELLARIHPTADAADAAGCDLVIEAVFEEPSVKRAAWEEIEPVVAGDALLGSNTSTMPITGLADNVQRTEDFIGLHFFSPVDKMPLLEIIKGEKTSDEALSKALDLAKQIKKTPIVVNDSRGFFTSRVIGTFINEGIAMVAEGIPAPTIEQASAQAGYPAPVLQLTDELNMKLMAKIRNATRDAVIAAGGSWEPHPAEAVLDRMLELDRPGKLEGRGFYDYAEGKRTGLWPDLHAEFASGSDIDPMTISLTDLKERMMFVEAIESVKCRDEGVIESTADANIGSIFGIGFPAWSGGVLQYIDNYVGTDDRRGPAGFVERARELAARYGERFDPPASLVEMAEQGGSYAAAAVAATA